VPFLTFATAPLAQFFVQWLERERQEIDLGSGKNRGTLVTRKERMHEL
jgi:hypothetical protein